MVLLHQLFAAVINTERSLRKALEDNYLRVSDENTRLLEQHNSKLAEARVLAVSRDASLNEEHTDVV